MAERCIERSEMPCVRGSAREQARDHVIDAMPDDARYAAMLARDRRFDGVFFVGVRTTGIYCRPICPARTPGRARCAFFATAPEAERAGFRACFRCRPELAPGTASVDTVDRLVAAAARRIAEGALNDASLDELAGELGVSSRHLRRAIESRLGVTPVELAQSRRLALAKQLLQDTQLPVTSIAFAAGFGSVRRFNALFAQRLGSAPSSVRRKRAGGPDGDRIALRLDYRPPYDFARILGFLGPRAIPGVEVVTADAYRRVVHLGGATGEITVRRALGRDALELEVAPALLPMLMPLVARVRRLFDLDARPDLIDGVLRRDRRLAPLVAARPGLRLPGAIDPFEAAMRALLGQQVSVAAARTLAGRFAASFGAPVGDERASSAARCPTSGAAGRRAERASAGQHPRVGARDDVLRMRFATAAEVAAAGPDRVVAIGMPMARARAIHGFACAIAEGRIALEAPSELAPFVESLVALPGIGPWTAQYLAMRALHVPDAFPAADLGIQKALGRVGAKRAEARAEAWRPYRAYAVMHLWTQLSEGAAP